jgi:predicted SnoaL-like aldol condensation-catalyzing enzyme
VRSAGYGGYPGPVGAIDRSGGLGKREAVERYAGGSCIRHNPEAADGKQAFIDYLVGMADEDPATGSSASG